jgi:1-acyl-sn-glycerol-3-phosphate acyltransferase
MIRSIIALVVVVIMTFICGLLAVAAGVVNPYSRVVYFIGQMWVRSILFVSGTKIDTTGMDKIDLSRNYVFISNHQSHFDVPAVFRVIPHTIRFLTKKELYKIPVFGWAIQAVGMIKIDRANREQAQASLNKAAEVMKKGVSIVVFPEGTRSKDGTLGQFKKGGFIIAIKAGIAIVPISISGSRFILKKHTMRIRSGKIRLVFDQPIGTTEYTLDQKHMLIEKVRNVIEQNIDPDYNNPDKSNKSGETDSISP